MTRALLLAALVLAPLASGAQTRSERAAPAEPSPDVSGEGHVVPFASGGHAIEIDLGAAPGSAKQTALSVEVQSAPAWLTVQAPEAGSDADSRLARVAFSVSPEAPVGEPGEIRLAVVSAGAVVGTSAVRIEVAAPEAATLGLPRPNPSRGDVTVPYVVPEAASVRVSVVDVLGREVVLLASGEVAPGAHQARIASGMLAAGVYAVVLTVEGAERQRRVRRLTVVR